MNRPLRAVVLGILGVGIALLPALAETDAGSTPSLKASLESNAGKAQRQIQIGEFELSFATPKGWKRLDEPSANKISFYSPDSKSVLTVRIQPDRFGDRLLMTEKTLLLMKRYPDAIKGIEAQWSGANVEGRQIDFSRSAAKGVGGGATYRLAAAPLSGGLLEVLFTTTEESFSQQSYLCDQALRTMHCTRRRESTSGDAGAPSH